MIGRIAGRFWINARSRELQLAKTGASLRDCRPRLLRIERLEDRRLLAVTLSFRTGSTLDAPLSDAVHAGQMAYVRVDDPTIADGMVQVGVWEDDGAGDDQIATFMVHVQSGVGFAPWVATWQGNDDGGPFNRYYLFASASNV
jgi:hypothetical protein